MPDEETTNPAQPSETPADGLAETPGTETPPEGEKATEDELPEWARKELTKARNEAANYRTRMREAEDKLKSAKTPEEFEAAVTEFRASNAALERQIQVTKVAAKYGLPEALAARLQGDDEAALEADAKSLASLVVAPKHIPESVSGGLTPGDSDDDFDPVAAAHAAKKRRY
jgi:hypothetical protein